MSHYTIQHYPSVPAVKAAFRSAGSHWFDKDTMAFFGSRIESGMRFNTFFVTSEDNFDRTERRYTVRYATSYGEGRLSMQELGEFQEHESLDSALDAIRAFIGNRSVERVDRALLEVLAPDPKDR